MSRKSKSTSGEGPTGRVTTEARREWKHRYNNSDKGRAAKRKWTAKNPKWTWAVLATERAKKRAAKAGVPFEINSRYLHSITPNRCPVFGYKFQWAGNGTTHPSSPTVDRLDPQKGYVPGNVAIISHKANTIKSSYGYEDVIVVAEWLGRIESRRSTECDTHLTSGRAIVITTQRTGASNMVPNPHKVPKSLWAKWRDAGRLVYNDLVSNGITERTAALRAWEATEKAIAMGVMTGPLPEEAPAEPVELTEAFLRENPPVPQAEEAAEQPKKTPARRRKAEKAE
jgi:hypothetical protein